MRKIVLLLVLFSIGTIAFSQEVTVRFTGQLNNSEYCRLDSVKVTNLTRNWTETVEYPDTIIVLGGTVGTNLNIAATQGLGQNVPNPFDCETRVELSVSQRENVRMQLLDASGKQYAEYSGSLDAGVHTFDISAANPQTYILNAVVGDRSYSIRMVNMGSGCGNSIKYAGISGGITAKLTSTNEFQNGDNMRYVGYTTISGQVVASDVKEQTQVVSQYVTLSFTHYSAPAVETLAATDITTTSATLHGNIINNGGTAITARGFYWGTTADNLSQVVSAGIGTGEYTADITGLSVATTYYYCAFATNNIGTSIGEVIPFETLSTTGTLNGHEWVDLGLPSGLLWATTNVGAENPEDYGNYFAWGETTAKTTYNWSTYRYCNGSLSTLTKYCNNGFYGNNGFTDNLTTLEASDDAATANWGSGWRMPTLTEMNELYNNCTVTWTIYNGVNGSLFTGPNGNSIFLPAAGYRDDSSLDNDGSIGNYWSSSLGSEDPYYAWRLYFISNHCSTYNNGRVYGLSVRAVCPSDSTGGENAIVPPTVTTGVASSITSTGTTISGNVTSDGGAIVTDRGFLYGTNFSNLTQAVQNGSGTGSFTANLTGLTSGITYYYKAYATNNAGTSYGEVRSFTTENTGATTGTLNGHDWVDLGLPSGLCWATCNVGANSPTAYGNYYAWGETNTKSTYTENNYTYLGNPTTLPSSADAATANWGSGWRMPTQTEMNELLDNCTHIWTTQNGINGRLFTGPNGNSIFLPAAGFCSGDDNFINAGYTGDYWSSSLYTDDPEAAWDLDFGSGFYGVDGISRWDGFPVRAVCPSGSTGGETTIVAPTVNTGVASSITSTGATLSGNITSDGGAIVTARGFLYGTNSSNLTQTMQSGSGTGSFTKALTDLTSGTTYYYKAYATNSAGTSYGEVRSFTTENTSTTTGTLNGHEWVDLGLPSGLLWATCNVGATAPEYEGNYYAWGETSPKDTYTWSTYRYCNGSSSTLTKYCNDAEYGNNGFTDNLTILNASDDAATANWGESWRMPTKEEMEELFNNCTFSSTGNGIIFIGPNGNSIFFPTVTPRSDEDLPSSIITSGLEYWSSSLCTNSSLLYSSPILANGLSSSGSIAISFRYCGFPVRPVTEGTTSTTGTLNGHDWVDLGLPSGTRWATCNVGANSPTDYGNYYAWGETTPKTYYGSDSYTDNPTTLPSSADAATANWGSGWRMPTYDELNELKNNCTVTWITQNGVNGRLFTGPNGNSIFLPAAGWRTGSYLRYAGSYGYYWSSSLYSDDTDYAWYLYFNSGNYGMSYYYRFYGCTVRAVCAQ